MRVPSLGGFVLTTLALAIAPQAQAHCDTMNGPVVAAAQAALRAGDVTPVLKWVRPDYEPEVRSAFARVLKVRAAGEDSRQLADVYFFETVVRLHRAGENVSYTGLKPAGAKLDPAVAAADTALEQGSIDDFARTIGTEVAAEVRHRFERARDARKLADRSVAAGREYVEAYVRLMHYLEQVHAPAHEH